MNNEDIYKMKLNEVIDIKDKYFTVLRVAGGWIYTNYNWEETNITSIFVKYDNEFKQENKDE